jgi:hypothetical protein
MKWIDSIYVKAQVSEQLYEKTVILPLPGRPPIDPNPYNFSVILPLPSGPLIDPNPYK